MIRHLHQHFIPVQRTLCLAGRNINVFTLSRPWTDEAKSIGMYLERTFHLPHMAAPPTFSAAWPLRQLSFHGALRFDQKPQLERLCHLYGRESLSEEEFDLER